jgi:hypothetical protein
VLKGNPIRGGLQAHSPLSLALAEQPPAPMPPSLLDGTTWGSLLSTSRSTHRYFRTSSRLFLKRFAVGPSCSLVGVSLVTGPW